MLCKQKARTNYGEPLGRVVSELRGHGINKLEQQNGDNLQCSVSTFREHVLGTEVVGVMFRWFVIIYFWRRVEPLNKLFDSIACGIELFCIFATVCEVSLSFHLNQMFIRKMVEETLGAGDGGVGKMIRYWVVCSDSSQIVHVDGKRSFSYRSWDRCILVDGSNYREVYSGGLKHIVGHLLIYDIAF
jgi:hypothetical protein